MPFDASPALLQDLRDAKALIEDPDCWIKHYSNIGHRYCAVGASWASIRQTPAEWGDVEQALKLQQRQNAVVEALQAQLLHRRDRKSLVAPLSVPGYNDHPATGHADIMALYDNAIAAELTRLAAVVR